MDFVHFFCFSHLSISFTQLDKALFYLDLQRKSKQKPTAYNYCTVLLVCKRKRSFSSALRVIEIAREEGTEVTSAMYEHALRSGGSHESVTEVTTLFEQVQDEKEGDAVFILFLIFLPRHLSLCLRQ